MSILTRLRAPVLVAGFALLVAVPASRPVAAQPAAPAPDLALIHPDALGFVHVKLADLWKHPSMADARKMVEAAGPKALATLDAQFVPKPTTAQRVTAIALPPTENAVEPKFVVALRFSEAFDPEAVRKSYVPAATVRKFGGKEVFAEPNGTALFFPDNQTLVLSDAETLGKYLAWAPKSEGGLSEAVKLAETKPLTIAANLARAPIPPGLDEQLPGDLRPLLKARIVTVTADMGKAVTLTGRISFATADEAKDGEKALRQMAQMGRAGLDQPRKEAEKALNGKGKIPRPIEELPEAIAAVSALGGLNVLDEFLQNPPLKTVGSDVTMAGDLPEWATQYIGLTSMSAGLMLPAVQKVRAAAARATSQNNLKQIALAMHNYHDVYNAMPKAAICDKNGKPLLSWRVAILPFIEQDALYKQFKLDEPWDSENNKKLIPILVKVYQDPRAGDAKWDGKTYYKVFNGKGAMFGGEKGINLAGITDGTSNTIMVGAGGEPVIWTKPDDYEFDEEKPLPELMKPFSEWLVAFGDGSVRVIPIRDQNDKEMQKTLKALITVGGGEVVEVP